MRIGAIFVLSLWALAGLAARSGVRWNLPLLALVVGLIIPVFGIVHMWILPGSAHWIVRTVHLLLGAAGMVLAARLDREIRARAEARGTGPAAESAPSPTQRAA